LEPSIFLADRMRLFSDLFIKKMLEDVAKEQEEVIQKRMRKKLATFIPKD